MSTHLSKTDSEVSSLTPSSPGRSPQRRPQPAYYVQSPSRDSSSHDGEKTTNSFHSSPALLSPSGSPSHPSHHSSLGPPSRGSSSSTRYSGSLKPAHRKAHPGEERGGRARRGKGFDAIEEEGLLNDGEGGGAGGVPRRCYAVVFVLGFFVMFSFFALILWGASRPQKPSIAMKSIVFDQFVVQAGTDFTGVATDMVSINSTVKLTFRNTATFFGLHVTATPLDLSYSQLSLATGSINKFYQSRKSQRLITVTLKGDNIPLYGGGADLSSVNGAPTQPVPLSLAFLVRSKGYVLGKLVKARFNRRIRCWVTMDPKKMSVVVSLKDKCTYQ
ncbi:hypothetical protein NL676_022925 [Syzygium grande]|nr:hypothetical protein NL676_022925 [Syzygium grande]